MAMMGVFMEQLSMGALAARIRTWCIALVISVLGLTTGGAVADPPAFQTEATRVSWVSGEIEANSIVTALVDVEWDGRWYPAQVLAAEGGLYFITYSGYDSSWNEWVDSSRIRKRNRDPVIASTTVFRMTVEYGTPVEDLPLPVKIDVVLKDGSSLEAGVEWNTEPYEGNQPGEYVLRGALLHLPVNLANPENVAAAVTLRVGHEQGSAAVLRTGAETGVEGLMFYIEQDEGLTGYYFGEDPSNLTHVIIEDSAHFVAMIVYEANLYPIQWVFPNLTVSVMVPRGESFNPKQAIHSFVLGTERKHATFDIAFTGTVEQVLEGIPPEYRRRTAAFKEILRPLGWLDMSLAEVAASASTPHEQAYAAFLTALHVRTRLVDQMSVGGEISAAAHPAGQYLSPGNPGMMFAAASAHSHGQVLSDGSPHMVFWDSFVEYARALAEKLSTVFAMLSYLERIASGWYGGHDIVGPAVSMLLCKGTSSVPSVCHEFYLPRDGLGRCQQVCVVSLGCFTDICHPKQFSVTQAIQLRRP
jgi:hypothetical protein